MQLLGQLNLSQPRCQLGTGHRVHTAAGITVAQGRNPDEPMDPEENDPDDPGEFHFVGPWTKIALSFERINDCASLHGSDRCVAMRADDFDRMLTRSGQWLSLPGR